MILGAHAIVYKSASTSRNMPPHWAFGRTNQVSQMNPLISIVYFMVN